jgi:hypothetical protein
LITGKKFKFKLELIRATSDHAQSSNMTLEARM